MNTFSGPFTGPSSVHSFLYLTLQANVGGGGVSVVKHIHGETEAGNEGRERGGSRMPSPPSVTERAGAGRGPETILPGGVLFELPHRHLLGWKRSLFWECV